MKFCSIHKLEGMLNLEKVPPIQKIDHVEKHDNVIVETPCHVVSTAEEVPNGLPNQNLVSRTPISEAFALARLKSYPWLEMKTITVLATCSEQVEMRVLRCKFCASIVDKQTNLKQKKFIHGFRYTEEFSVRRAMFSEHVKSSVHLE